MMGSNFSIAVFGRPFWIASSTSFHCASRGAAKTTAVLKATMMRKLAQDHFIDVIMSESRVGRNDGLNAPGDSAGSSHEPAPLPACGQPLPALRGEGRERGANLVSASPLLTPPSWGEGIDQRHGGGVLDAPPFAVRPDPCLTGDFNRRNVAALQMLPRIRGTSNRWPTTAQRRVDFIPAGKTREALAIRTVGYP